MIKLLLNLASAVRVSICVRRVYAIRVQYIPRIAGEIFCQLFPQLHDCMQFYLINNLNAPVVVGVILPAYTAFLKRETHENDV